MADANVSISFSASTNDFVSQVSEAKDALQVDERSRGLGPDEGNRLTRHRALFPMAALEALDIDTEEDWDLAAALYASRTAYAGRTSS